MYVPSDPITLLIWVFVLVIIVLLLLKVIRSL